MSTRANPPTTLRLALTIGAVAAVVALVLSGCAATYEDGRRALEAGDVERADQMARDRLAEQPDSPWANQLLAETLVARGHYDEALPYATDADETDAFPVRTPRLLGEIHRARNNPVEAARAYHRARRTDEGAVDDETFVQVLEEGLAQARTRADHQARLQLADWLAETDPDHPDVSPEQYAVVRRARAVELRRQGDYAQAVSLLEEALNEDPDHLRGEALDLGKIYARMEMPDQARRAWQKYLDEPVDADESIQRHLDVAGAAARHEMIDVAVEILEDLPERIDDPHRRGEVMLQLARYQLQSDRRADGRRTVYDYIEMHTADAPDGRANPVPYRRAAELADQLDRTRLRINILERAAEEAEPTRTLTKQLADIYAHRAQIDSARELFEQYVDRHDDPYTAEAVAARWARQRHNFEFAQQFYRRAADRPEARPEILRELAAVFGELGEYHQMEQVLDEYLRARDTSEDALSSAADLLADHHRYEQSENLMSRLHDRAPDRRRYTRQFADLYYDWGRPARAAEIWETWIEARGEDPSDIVSVAGVLARADDLDRAAGLYERAARLGEPDRWLDAADLHLRRDDETALVRTLESHVREAEDRTPALVAAVERYDEAGMTHRKMDALLELVDRHPQRWDLQRRLAALMFDRGRTVEAFDHLRAFVDRADDPAAALTRIADQWTSPDRAPWLLDFYREYYGDEAAEPTLQRLIGDAYHALTGDDELHQQDTERALRRARRHYRRFLEATEQTDRDWDELARQWARKNMWHAAATGFERAADQNDATSPAPLSHAEALLHLGRTDRATELLRTHFRDRHRPAELAGRIAELLVDFAMYDEAAEFASHLLVSGHGRDIGRGFGLMVDIHAGREAYDRLPGLVSDFLDRSSNDDRARRTATGALEELGQWELTADHLGDIDTTALHQFAIQAGHHHYRAGDPDRALRAYHQAAEHAARPETAWLEAGRFLERRGDFDRAREAYDRAVSINPDDLGVRAGRGAFSIRRGDVRTGWDDYATARQTTGTLRSSRRAEFFEAFEAIGHFDSARTVFDHFAEDDQTPPDRLVRRVGTRELKSPDTATRRTGIDRIDSVAWGMFETLEHLDETGHHDESLRMIETEFDHGDATTAAVAFLNRSTPMSYLVGWDRQRRWLDAVVDPLERGDGRLIGPVGDYRIRAGDLEEGRRLLRAAVDHDADYLPQYAHTLLVSGDHREASEVFETMLRDGRAGPQALENILRRFELAGAVDHAHRFVQRLAAHPPFVDFALPAWTHYRLEDHGDAHRVVRDLFETVESLRQLPTTAFRTPGRSREIPGLSPDDLIDRALIDSLRVAAALGFTDAVESALTDVPVSDDRPELDELRLQLALVAGDLERADEMIDRLLEAAPSPRDRQQQRTRLARRLVAHGHVSPASRLVDEALEHQTDFRDHTPVTLQIGLRVLEGDTDVADIADDYLERVPNRRDARRTLVDELHRMGLDDQALRLAREGMRLEPTAETSRRAATIAFADGDRSALKEALDKLFVVADDPVGEIERSLLARLPGADPQLATTVVERVRRARPHELDWTIEHARVLFDAGRQPEARAMLTDVLEARDYHPLAVTRVASMLSDHNLDVELAEVLAPAVDDRRLWPELTIAFAEAELALGDKQRAERRLDRLDDTAQTPAMWRIELGDRLLARGLYDALEVAVGDVDPDDAGPYLDTLRGVRRLADGRTERGIEALQAANDQGVDRFRTHHAGIRAALEAGHPEAARELMADLLELATRDDDIVSLPVQILLSAAMEMPRGAETIREFLSDHRPRLLDGRGVYWTEFTGQMARTFELTDDPQGAFGFYTDRIWQARFLGDDQPVPTYLNNLAFSYATTDTDIEAGLDKIRRAIVVHPERPASFIDTLGWLLYRDDDLEAAEDEIRRALRSYRGGPTGLDQQLEHLEIISRQRGFDGRAADIATHRNRLPPEGLDW